LCLLGLRLRRGPRPARRERFRTDLVEGWREFRARGWVWGVILVWMVLMITTFGPLTPLVATEIITSHGDTAYGLVNSIGGAGMAVGGLIAMRLRPRHPLRAGAIAMLAYGIQPLLVALHAPIWLVALGFAIAGGVQTFWSVMWATSIQTQIPGSILNRIHAYEVAGSLAMMPVGQALAGPAAGVSGSGPVLLVGAVAAVAGMVALLLARPVRDLGRAEHPEPLTMSGRAPS
jgi:MFS family permease